MAHQSYKARQFDLSGLNGISDKTLELHFKLYEGYVKNINLLNEQLEEISRSGLAKDETIAFDELTRRLGFELNGMVLHEYYFGNLRKGGAEDPARNSSFLKSIEASFGDYQPWRKHSYEVRNIRSGHIASSYQEPTIGWKTNNRTGPHQEVHRAGISH